MNLNSGIILFFLAGILFLFSLGGCSEKSDKQPGKDTVKTTQPSDSNKNNTSSGNNINNGKEKSPVEGIYEIGGKTCVIGSIAKVYKVSWSDGVINILNLSADKEKDYVVWIEHKDENDKKIIGKFLFDNWSYKSGVYRTATGKEMKITRKD